ncbi:MAG: hypothetical protein DRP74_08110 [Candidatus Omnitrophota bacterium]|mgnify:CR=1 FL=1|nr:MAG: hypothetical protein DRP74_08110 [Candidatus Omnitrophota bacterium]
MALRTLGDVIRVDGATVYVDSLGSPKTPCQVVIGGVNYQAMSHREYMNKLVLNVVGDSLSSIGSGDTVQVNTLIEVEAVAEYYGTLINAAALIAIDKDSRPHKIKAVVSGVGVYQYFDGISSGDLQPVDSDGTGEDYGNGWWLQIVKF